MQSIHKFPIQRTRREEYFNTEIIQPEQFHLRKLMDISRQMNELEAKVARQAHEIGLMQLVTAFSLGWCILTMVALVMVVK